MWFPCSQRLVVWFFWRAIHQIDPDFDGIYQGKNCENFETNHSYVLLGQLHLSPFGFSKFFQIFRCFGSPKFCSVFFGERFFTEGPLFVHLLRSLRGNASESLHDDVTSRVWWCRGSSVSSPLSEAWWPSILINGSAMNLDDFSNRYIGDGWKSPNVHLKLRFVWSSSSSVGFKDFWIFLDFCNPEKLPKWFLEFHFAHIFGRKMGCGKKTKRNNYRNNSPTDFPWILVWIYNTYIIHMFLVFLKKCLKKILLPIVIFWVGTSPRRILCTKTFPQASGPGPRHTTGWSCWKLGSKGERISGLCYPNIDAIYK